MSGIIAGIGMGAQALLGVGQTIAGLTMPKPSVPDYDIPQEVYQNMTDAEHWALQGLPEAQRQNYIDQISQQGATALAQSGSRKSGMGMIASIAETKRQGSRELLGMDAAARAKNQEMLYSARNAMTQQKGIQQQWSLDKVNQERADRKEMIGAGMQNIGGAFGSAMQGDMLGMFGKGQTKDLGTSTGGNKANDYINATNNNAFKSTVIGKDYGFRNRFNG